MVILSPTIKFPVEKLNVSAVIVPVTVRLSMVALVVLKLSLLKLFVFTLFTSTSSANNIFSIKASPFTHNGKKAVSPVGYPIPKPTSLIETISSFSTRKLL